MNFLLVGNGPSANRGCQAIERTTIQMLSKRFNPSTFIIGSESGDLDSIENTDSAVKYFCLPMGFMGRNSSWLGYRLFNYSDIGTSFSQGAKFVKSNLQNIDAVLSLGGDLYGPSYGRFQLFHYTALMDRSISKKVPTIIWPATIGPFDKYQSFDRRILEQLRHVGLILCRDEWSFEHLHDLGFSDNLELVADPAFLLEPRTPSKDILDILPNNLEECIGINLSPYIRSVATNHNINDWVTSATLSIIEIMKATRKQVVLIPHVGEFRGNISNSDWHFLIKVSDQLHHKGLNVTVIPLLNSDEMKWIISKVELFVGARTHATIASFGSKVPTLCIGYSEKSRALTKLFYGNDEIFLDGRLFSTKVFVEKILTLLGSKDSLRREITMKLPTIIKRAQLSLDHLDNYFTKLGVPSRI